MITLEVERNSPWSLELYGIARVDWDAFFSLTFQRKPRNQKAAVCRFFKYLRKVCPQLDLDYRRVEFALRYEHGEKTGRPHLHALMRNIPVNDAAIFTWKHGWEGAFVKFENASGAVYSSGRFEADANGIGFGSARVRRYTKEAGDETAEYFTKAAAAQYEANKVRTADYLFLSRALTNRLRRLTKLEAEAMARLAVDESSNQANAA